MLIDLEEQDTGFRFVINTLDSSLWLIFEFKRFKFLGYERIIREGDEWGKLAPDDLPFIAARIANAVLDSGIGKRDWPIPIPPHSKFRGGPGAVRVYSVDDDFIQRTIPVPSSAWGPKKAAKKLDVDRSTQYLEALHAPLLTISEAPGVTLTHQ